VRYSTPDGHQGGRVWVRVVGDEIVITATAATGLAEIARHRLSTPGKPRILDAHYSASRCTASPRPPKIRPRTETEVAFLDLGEGAHRWLVEAAATGVTRIRTKMLKALELAAALGPDSVDEALGLAAIAGRFADEDLPSIVDHLATSASITDVVRADENHSAQPGTSVWEGLGE